MPSKQQVLLDTLVELADNLTDDFDVVELLTVLTDRCVEAFDIRAAGLMLAAPMGADLRVMSSSSTTMRDLELYELQAQEGPCLDAYRSGQKITNENLDDALERWPRFAPAALDAGFRSVNAIPMQLRGVTIGALNLFRTDTGAMDDAEVAAAQALADVATIAILQQQAAVDAQVVNQQLNHALNSRITLEQAKGVLAERGNLDLDSAFHQLREYARNNNRRLSDVARDVVEGTLAVPSTSADA